MTLPGWVAVREPRARLGGLYVAKNVTICPTYACTTPGAAFKVVLATFSELPMARTDVVGVPVRACRSLSGGVRPQIAGSYLRPDAPKLAQASKMVVLTHLSDDRS